MDPDPVCPERLDPVPVCHERLDLDPVCPERLNPDPVNIRPETKSCLCAPIEKSVVTTNLKN